MKVILNKEGNEVIKEAGSTNYNFRRKWNKKNGTNYTKKDFDVAIALARLQGSTGIDLDSLKTLTENGLAHIDNSELVPDGTEVKVNAKEILGRNDSELTKDFIDWIKENEDTVFHLEREENKQSLVCLEEDNRKTVLDGEEVNAPKWLFDLYSDILVRYEDEWIPVWKYDQLKNKSESLIKSEAVEENGD